MWNEVVSLAKRLEQRHGVRIRLSTDDRRGIIIDGERVVRLRL